MLYKGYTLSVPLYGLHNVYNIIAAVALAEEFDIGPEEIKEGLCNFENIPGRSQIIKNGWIIVDDTYNANPLSSRYALESAAQVFAEKRKIAVLSDMKELGSSSESYHREIGKQVFLSGFEMLCVWGQMSDCYIDGARRAGMDRTQLLKFSDKIEMIEYLKACVTEKDMLLVKGSRSMKMEEVVNALRS